MAYSGGQQVFSPYAAMDNSPGMMIDPNGEMFEKATQRDPNELSGEDFTDVMESSLASGVSKNGKVGFLRLLGMNSGGGGGRMAQSLGRGVVSLFSSMVSLFDRSENQGSNSYAQNSIDPIGTVVKESEEDTGEGRDNDRPFGTSYDKVGQGNYEVIVVNDPSGAIHMGHTAILVGNSEKGYRFVSKNGGGSSGVSGFSDVTFASYSTLSEFYNSKEGKRYKDAIVYNTDVTTAQLVLEKAHKSARTYYLLIDYNCMRSVIDGLYKGGMTEINPSSIIGIQPNRIFLGLVNERKGKYHEIKR